MTPDHFRACARLISERFGWDVFGRGPGSLLATVLQIDDRTVRRMFSGGAPVPADVAKWVNEVHSFHRVNPPPLDGVTISAVLPLAFVGGVSRLPPEVADWLERVERFHRENPPPVPPGRTPDADRDSPRGPSPE